VSRLLLFGTRAHLSSVVLDDLGFGVKVPALEDNMVSLGSDLELSRFLQGGR
jgi:hypothetical protein